MTSVGSSGRHGGSASRRFAIHIPNPDDQQLLMETALAVGEDVPTFVRNSSLDAIDGLVQRAGQDGAAKMLAQYREAGQDLLDANEIDDEPRPPCVFVSLAGEARRMAQIVAFDSGMTVSDLMTDSALAVARGLRSSHPELYTSNHPEGHPDARKGFDAFER